MPIPNQLKLAELASPVPTYMTSGSYGSMAMSPMVRTAWSSKMGSHVVPPSVDL